jgi:hypothetical protein
MPGIVSVSPRRLVRNGTSSPSRSSRRTVNVHAVEEALPGNASPGLTRAYGFKLLSFSHNFTPVFPLSSNVPTYQSLGGETRVCYPSASGLCVELFMAVLPVHSCFRIVCDEGSLFF